MDKVELKKELKKINRKLFKIAEASLLRKNQSRIEKNLWRQKRKILAKFNPINP